MSDPVERNGLNSHAQVRQIAFWVVISLTVVFGHSKHLVHAAADRPLLSLDTPTVLWTDYNSRNSTVRLAGNQLETTKAVWSSWAGWGSSNVMPDGLVSVRQEKHVELYPHNYSMLPAGPELVRVLTPDGLSNLKLVFIETLRKMKKGDTNFVRQSATSLTAPDGALEDTAVSRGFRYYSIPLRKGKRISLQVVARQMGSKMDPVLRILDASGKESCYENDSPGLDGDVAVSFRPPNTGNYLVEVRDAEFGGGSGHFYLFRWGKFPSRLVMEEYEPIEKTYYGGVPEDAITRGSSKKVAFCGVISRYRKAQWIDAFRGEELPSTSLNLKLANGSAVERFRSWALYSIFPRWLEAAEGVAMIDEMSRPTSKTVVTQQPTIIHGKLKTSGEIDWWTIDVKSNSFWRFSPLTRVLGWPGDPVLVLETSDGRALATSNPEELDGTLQYRFDTIGNYRLGLKDAGGMGGKVYGYRIDVEPNSPGFTVSSTTDAVHLKPGTEAGLKLSVKRYGYDGPILLDSSKLPTWVRVVNPKFESKGKEWDLKFNTATNSDLGKVESGRLLFKAERGGGLNTQELDLRPVLRGLYPSAISLNPGFVDRVWFVTVKEVTEIKDGKE